MLEENKKGLNDVTLPKKNIDQAFPGLKHKGTVSNHASQRLKPAESLSMLYLRVSAWIFLMLRNLLASHSLVGLKHMVEQQCGGWACAPSHHNQNQFQSPTQRTANVEGH